MNYRSWPILKLKDIGKTLTGTTPPKSESAFYGDYIPFIRPAELDVNGRGEINYKSQISLSFEGAKVGRVVPRNSILMCCVGSVGKTAFATREITCNQQINVLIPTEKYSAKYIYYALISPTFQKAAISIANSAKATLPIISKGKWENLSIPVPPLPEQQQIVDYLDSAFAKIDQLKANAEKQLQDAQSLFSAALEEAMSPKAGWEEKTLGNLFKIGTGSTPNRKNMAYFQGHNPWVKTTEVHNCEIWSTEESISDNAISETNCKLYQRGTVLLAMYGQGKTRGQVALLQIEAATNQACAAIQPTDNVQPQYLFYFLLSKYEYIRSLGKGCNQKNLNLEIVKKIKFTYPSLETQQQIVSHLDALSAKVNQLKENYKLILTECDALNQALLREIFE